MTWKPILFAAGLAVLASCALAPAKPDKADVPIADLPPAIVSAAEKAVPGVHLTEAKRRSRKATTFYKLAGNKDGKAYEMRINADGTVLKVEQEGAARARRGKVVLARIAGESPARQIGAIDHPAIRESSGLAASRRHPGVFWTHNDKGNPSAIYAIDHKGVLLAEYEVAIPNTDFEDIATDGDGKLYLGNIGNNGAKRTTLEVHRLSEPHPAHAAQGGSRLQVEKTWRLRFPSSAFDCESLVIHNGSGYVISKLFTGEPAAIYRFPLDGDGDVVLEKVVEIPVKAPVTAADLSADGRALAVLSAAGLHLFTVDGDIARAKDAKPEEIALPDGKLEGVCFTADGILMTAESRQVYHIAR